MHTRAGRIGISNAAFAASVVILLAVAAGALGLYATKPSASSTVTETQTGSTVTVTRSAPASTQTEVMNHTETMTHTQTTTEVMNHTATMTETMVEPAIQFTPVQGQMMHDAYVIIAPLGNGSYALTIHAQGLEGPSMGAYIVEATLHGTNNTVPIGGQNATLSEFEADGHGNGQFYIVLSQNPMDQFSTLYLVFLPGMQMTNAVVVATAHIGM